MQQFIDFISSSITLIFIGQVEAGPFGSDIKLPAQLKAFLRIVEFNVLRDSPIVGFKGK